MKELFFEGDSLDELANFSLEARRAAGFELWQVQCGLMPSDWKPMLSVGQGAYEIRIKVQGEWRIIYVAKFSDGVHVLHAFQKKTRQTRKEDIDLAGKRYRDLGARR
jgi:phage-related protein